MRGSVFSGFSFAPGIKDLSRIESKSTQTSVKAGVELVMCNIHSYDWESKHRGDKSLGLAWEFSTDVAVVMLKKSMAPAKLGHEILVPFSLCCLCMRK